MPKNGSTSAPTREHSRPAEAAPLIPILARRVREVEARAARGKIGPTNRARFQVIAMLVRDERTRILEATGISSNQRGEQLKRLDGIATILARTATRDTTLLNLLDPDLAPSRSAQEMRNEWLTAAGIELTDEQRHITDSRPTREISGSLAQKQVTPASVKRYRKAVTFQTPVFDQAAEATAGLLTGWELLDPLYRAFDEGAGG